MTVKLLTEHQLEFLSLKGDYTGSSKSILVKMPHCWKSCVTAQMVIFYGWLINTKMLIDNRSRGSISNHSNLEDGLGMFRQLLHCQ